MSKLPIVCIALLIQLAAQAQTHFPPRHDWQMLPPAEAGIGAFAPDQALRHARDAGEVQQAR